jgi:hypothetical protein
MATPPASLPSAPSIPAPAPAPSVSSFAMHTSGIQSLLPATAIPLDTTPVTLTPYAGEYFNI